MFKSIKNNYKTLLESFAKEGIKFTDAQKQALAGFMVSLQKNFQAVQESKDKASFIKGKKSGYHNGYSVGYNEASEKAQAVLRKSSMLTEAQYREKIEKIIRNITEHNTLASKINLKKAVNEDHRELSRKLDNYLKLYVEDVLPKKQIVDYKKMQKLQDLVESLKNVLVVNDDDFASRAEKIEESVGKENFILKRKLARANAQLNESAEKNMSILKRLDMVKARRLVEASCKDIPDFEAKKILEHFCGSSLEEVKKNFKKVYESVSSGKKPDEEDPEDSKSLEEEIKNIVSDGSEDDDSSSSDDEKTRDEKVKANESEEDTDAEDDEEDPEETEKDSSEDSDKSDKPAKKQANESVLDSWIKSCANISPING